MVSRNRQAFTIVELLVVIVVIGILAAITIVAYTGISQKAVASSLQSDLTQASKQLEMFYVDNSFYPQSISNCPTPTLGNLCIKQSPNNTFSYTPGTNTNAKTYVLTASYNTTNYTITNNSKPIATAPLNPVADWLAVQQGDHYGNFYDLVTKSYATVTRATPKTIYDPATQHIYDIPANQLAVNPRSDGKSGYEALIEEGRSNLLPQSSFEGTISGWSYQYIANGSVESSTDRSVYGNSSMKITRIVSSSEANVWKNLSGLDNSTVYSYFVWAWADTSNTACIFTYLATVDVASTCHSGSSKWERLGGQFTSTATGTVQLRLSHKNASPNLNSVYFDAVQVEKGTFATSYIPTTTTAILRDADITSIPTTNWNMSSGSVFGSVGLTPVRSSYQNILTMTPDNTSKIALYRGSGANVGFQINGSAYSGPIQTSDVPHIEAGTWVTGGNQIAYQDSVGVSRSPAPLPTINNIAYIGSGYLGGIYYYNGPISRIVVYSNALSGSDVLSVTNYIKDGP